MALALPGAGCASRNDSASGAQVIDGSLRFLAGFQNTAYATFLKRTPSADGNRRTYTFSVWCTRSQLTGMPLGNGYNSNTYDLAGANDFRIEFESGTADALNLYDATMSGTMDVTTNALYRDVDAWYHIVVVVNTPEGTDSNRSKLYVNGVQVTSLGTASYPNEEAQGDWNDASYVHYLGQRGTGSHWDGKMSQYYFIDGQALDASDFGYTDPLTNTWRPKKFIPPYTPNKGQNWAGMCSGSTNAGNGYEKAFDGADNENCYPSPGSTVTMTIPAGQLKWTTSFEVWVSRDLNGGNITVNGGSAVVPPGHSFHIVDLTGEVAAGADITEITWDRASSGSIGIAMYYIMIDGVALFDNDKSNFGGNGFYFPFDGSALIGEDQSGRGNHWTPVNFNGSVSLDKATGGLPILNTVSGGGVAAPGVRTDSNYSSCLLALPLIGNTSDYSNQINSGSTTKTATASGASASVAGEQNLYSGSYKFDGSNDEIVITSTDFSPGTGPFTIECWFNQSATGEQRILTSGNGTSSGQKSHYQMVIKSDRKVEINYDTSAGHVIASAAGLVNINQWHHFAMTRDSASPPKMSVWLDGKEVASGTSNTGFDSNNTEGITIGRESTGSSWWNGYISDVRYYNAVCKYTSDFLVGSPHPDILPDTPSGVSYGSELTKITEGSVGFDGSGDYLSWSDNSDFALGTGDFTVECWVYPASLPNSYNALIDCRDSTTQATGWILGVANAGGSGGLGNIYIYNDGFLLNSGAGGMPSGKWSHVAYVRDSGNHALYVDGIQKSTSSSSYNYTVDSCKIGGNYAASGEYWEGHISNVRIVKGTAVYTAAFTPPTSPLTNITNTKLLCCQNNTDVVAAAVTPGTITANGNTASTTFNPFDSDISTVMGKSSRYCTLNPIGPGNLTTRNGNLTFYKGSTDWESILGTMPMTAGGKWYFEVFCENAATGDNSAILEVGCALESFTAYASYLGTDSNSWTYQNNNGASGQKSHGGSSSTYGVSAATGDTIGLSLDLSLGGSSGILTFYINGVSQGYAYNNLDCTVDYFPAFAPYGEGTGVCNFGQKPFKFSPPEGFEPLVLPNLPSPGFVRPDSVVGVTIYTGTGNSLAITGLDFQPDLLWFKSRSNAAEHHLQDAVRGVTKMLQSDTNAAEITDSNLLTSFDSDGFTLPADSSGESNNVSGWTWVSWAWKAGGNKNTFNIDDVGYATAAAAGLSAGDTTITGASVNTQSGFSIIKYTGPNDTSNHTVAHGLTQAPDCVIAKNLDTTYNWDIYNSAMDDDKYMVFADSAVRSQGFNGRPTSTVINTEHDYSTNENQAYIAYCWHNLEGVQKFGKYVGNSNASGTYVGLGFRPALVWIKANASNSAWILYDNARSTYNPIEKRLKMDYDSSQGDSATYAIDFLSNGFKLRTTDSWTNGGQTYYYFAWAESPMHNLYGGQSNAR